MGSGNVNQGETMIYDKTQMESKDLGIAAEMGDNSQCTRIGGNDQLGDSAVTIYAVNNGYGDHLVASTNGNPVWCDNDEGLFCHTFSHLIDVPGYEWTESVSDYFAEA